MNEDIWEKNKKWLEVSRPALLKLILESTKNFSKEIKIEYSRKGSFPVFLRKNKEGNFIPVQSRIDPLKEAERILKLSAFKNTDTLIIYGLGSGAHIEILKSLPFCPKMVVVLETDPYLVRAFFSVFHLDDLLKLKWLQLLTLPTLEEYFSFLQKNTIYLEANKITPVKCPQIMRLNLSSYIQLEQKLGAFRQWAASNITTQVRAGAIFSENILKNLKHVDRSYFIKDFKNKFTDKTAFIVAGGPSLEKNGLYLKKIAGKALIFAVDTAYAYLKEKGIKADFIVSTDFTKNAADYFTEEDEHSPFLLADFEVCPLILDNYAGPLILAGINDKSLLDWIIKKTGDFGALPKGLSVSHTAFDAALYMGVKKVVFVGQDLAYSMNKSHVKGASHGVYMEGKSEVLLPGYFSMVPSSKSLKVFLDHYEEMISRIDIDVVDATEGGALIKGAGITLLKEQVFLLSGEKEFNVKAIIGERNSAADYGLKIKESLKELALLSTEAVNIYTILAESAEALKKEFSKDTLDIVKTADCLHDYHQQCLLTRKTVEITECLRDMLLEAIFLKAKRIEPYDDSFTDENKKRIIKSLDRDCKYYQLVVDALLKLKNILE